VRQTPPCLGYAGVTDQLKALASRQRTGGWQGLVVITGTPAWAAAAPAGCERAGLAPRSRAPAALALPAYRALVSAVLALASREGAELRYWSAWNEPNHWFFLSPQRGRCTASSPSRSPAAYGALARTLQAALAAAPGEQEMVLGELAGFVRPTRDVTAVEEFIRALPRSLVCATRVWSQHAYVGAPDPVDAAVSALGRAHCGQQHVVWITETGVGPAPRTFSAGASVAGEAVACAALHRRLERWWRDPRVAVATQYTLREDAQFRTGLVTTDLARARPALAEWTAWGGSRAASDPPPARSCPAQ
jgi:hypothetical protein